MDQSLDRATLASLEAQAHDSLARQRKLEAEQLILAGTTLGLYTGREGDQINVKLNGEEI